MYEKGEGGKVNFKKALEWYTKAANQDFCDAQVAIGKETNKQSCVYLLLIFLQGMMHYYGYGVPINYSKAMEWFLKADKQNSGSSHYCIGITN